MTNFINKHFRKHKCVKILYFVEGRKQEVHYVIPTGSGVRIKNHVTAFVLNDKEFFLDEKGFITYVLTYGRVEPVDPTNAENLGGLTPADLDVAIDSKVASEILQATKSSTDIQVVLFVFIGVMVLGMLALWYTTNARFDDLTETLRPITEVLN